MLESGRTIVPTAFINLVPADVPVLDNPLFFTFFTFVVASVSRLRVTCEQPKGCGEIENAPETWRKKEREGMRKEETKKQRQR